MENQEWKVYLKQLQNNPPAIFRLGWGADYPDPDNFMKLFTANSGNNHTRWKNKKYDQLLELAARELDTRKRAKLYDEAQKILAKPICRSCRYFGSPKHLLNPHFTGLESIPWRAWTCATCGRRRIRNTGLVQPFNPLNSFQSRGGLMAASRNGLNGAQRLTIERFEPSAAT